uniref:Contactin associated protein like 3 n=1 Tax=Monopterus albus TaxID=43700 RepID=A0A3Q3IY14_MONAL
IQLSTCWSHITYSTLSSVFCLRAGGWSPLTSDQYQWLEVDLGERTKLTAVATQGRYGSSDWLTSYLLMFSDTGHNWQQYRQEDSIGAFPGNSNADSVVQYKLQQPVIARFLRLFPLDWNPIGRIGLRLEAYGSSDVVSLDGSSSLVYRLSPGLRRTSKEVVSLNLKTLRNSGTLLHAEGWGGLSLSLELERGKLLLLLRQGGTSSSEPRRLASLGSLLDDQHWHRVVLERQSAHLNLTVDKHTETVQIPAEFSHWDIEQSLDSENPVISTRDFHGCLENLLYNDLNLIEQAKRNDHQVTVMGNVTFSCAEPVTIAVTFPGPQSFLQVPGPTVSTLGGLSVGFQFRTWNKVGLLLTFDLLQQGGVAWLYLSEARVQLQIHKDGTTNSFPSPGSALNDGQWHSVDLNSRYGRFTITVDKKEGGVSSPSFPVTVGRQLFFGGKNNSENCSNPFDIFQGCMRLLTVDNQPVDLIMVQQRLLGNYSHLQIDMCGITDRCSPSHCEHGGRCSQSWTVFHCNCSDTDLIPPPAVYEQSCEAYKHNGNTSGHYYIDVDGSGPIKPQLVYCNMTEENTWMVIQHNNSELTRVRPSPGVNQHLLYFDYSSEEEHLLAVISQSEHCEQELSYHCRKSRLLNTPEGSPFSWWLGGPGPGHLQTYWGGAQPDSQQCACGLQGDCVDPQHYCNCDADRTEWYCLTEDSGLLTHMGSLPVRSLVLGDIQRPGSEATYRVGPLRCHGDKNLWNAAFFDKETSYLHFPTFHGELSADITFLFKTTSSSGVFLENLGIKDFIRIELSSSTQVVFSFDVGNGPLEVHVESSVPLNDNRWHRVRAERNVKEALLQLDELPAATQEAPADGHFHLQLNSQLFIGTASRQKGFRGCIRSLQLNGVTLDLEERAKITPGVRPGCPGHCSSYGSLCLNQGHCVERASGFHCDCGLSAYAGVFCHTEVSASFKSDTSVSYTFKEPYEFIRNSSALPSSIYSDTTLRGENVSLSFRTNQSPALLLYVSSHYREYLALLINEYDKLEVRYKLDNNREAEVLTSSTRSLANGQLHTVAIQRVTNSVSVTSVLWSAQDESCFANFFFILLNYSKSPHHSFLSPDSDDLDPDLAKLASLGFIGCLSAVHFNSINPLKAALLHPDTSPIIIAGPLVQSSCGSSASANPYTAENTHHLSGTSEDLNTFIHIHCLAGVIAVVIFVIVTGLAITARFLYRRKETYVNRDVKGVKERDSPDFPFNNQTDSQNVSSENPKEYFI